MRIHWTKAKVIYVVLLVLSVIAGSYSGYTSAAEPCTLAQSADAQDGMTAG